MTESLSKHWKIFALLAGLILIIYGQSLWGGYVFDDRGINDYRGILSDLGSLKEAALQPYWEQSAGLYRPTTLLSYAFNIIFLGGSAFSFHLVNLLLYFGICVTIFIFLKRLFGNEKLALLSALIYLVLPIHTEVVANITGRSELLSLLFSLLLLTEFTKERVNFWLAGIYMLLAIGAKETAIAALPLVLLVILIKERTIGWGLVRQYFRPVSATVIGVSIYFFVRFFVLGPDHFSGVETSLIENPLLFASTPDRIATALSIFWMYIQKSFVPLNLCSDYSYNQIPVLNSFAHLSTLLGLVILIGSAIGSLYFLKRKPIVSLSLGIFFLGFLLVSNIFFPIGTIAGERLFFFPSLGLVILLALLLSNIGRKELIIVVLIVYSLFSFHRQGFWLTEEKLFLNALECAPNSVLSRSNAGAAYLFRGELDKAAEQLEISRSIKPIYSKGLNNLGLVYWKQGRVEEAKNLYHESLKQKYPYPGAIENLGLLYLGTGEWDKARGWLSFIYTPEMVQQIIKRAQEELK
jgi:protein O-mannosyl-transferase